VDVPHPHPHPQASDECSKYLDAMKKILCGDGAAEPVKDNEVAIAQKVYETKFVLLLVQKMDLVEFEVSNGRRPSGRGPSGSGWQRGNGSALWGRVGATWMTGSALALRARLGSALRAYAD